MKKFIKGTVLFSVLLTSLCPCKIFATETPDSKTVVIKKKDRVIIPKDIDEDGKRLPSRPIICTIDCTHGVSFDSYVEFISSYEIWSEDGDMCIFSSDNDLEFAKFIVNSSTPYMINLISENYIYSGWL